MKIIRNKNVQSFFYSLLSIIGIHYMSLDKSYGNIIYLLFFVIIFYIRPILIKKKNKINLIFSILSSIIFMVGKEIYCYHEMSRIIDRFYFYLFYFIGLVCVFYILYEILNIGYHKLLKFKKKEVIITKKEKIIGLLGLIVTHCICYLSYYPSMYGYDASSQMSMINKTSPLSNFHPIVHTLLISLFAKLESFLSIKDVGVLYTIFQVIFVIGTYCYFLSWVVKKGFSKKFIIGSYLYFAFNPILLIFSLCTTKDVLFGMFLLLFLTSIYDFYHERTIKNGIKYVLFGIFTCLFRNNMIYVMVAFGLFLVLCFRKKKIHYLSLVIVTTILLFNHCLSLLHIKVEFLQEKMSIPLSQMSYVYLYETTYTDLEKMIIAQYVPGIEEFNPRFADDVKYRFKEEKYKQNKKEFIQLYLKGLQEHPFRYLCVFLDMNVVYWYPNAKTIDDYSQRGYIEDYTYYEYQYKKSQEEMTFLKVPYQYFHNVSRYDSFLQKLPLLSNYFLLSFSFWFMLVSAYLYCLERRDKSLILILSVLILLFSTYLLGPVSNFRYIYPYYLVMPLLLGLLLYGKKEVVD